MSNMVEIWCKNGAHFYMRESKRGRPPKNCPEHLDIPSISPKTDKKEPRELICELGGGHTWLWTPQKGRVPKSCPEHRPTKIDASTEGRVSWCKAGDHEWMAPRQRGRVPQNCPEHTSIQNTRNLTSEDKAKRISEGKQKSREEREAKERATIRENVLRLRERVVEAERFNDEKLADLNKLSIPKKFGSKADNDWIKANSRLLSTVIALRAHERKAHDLGISI